MDQFSSEPEYLAALERRGRMPRGFRRAVTSLEFKAPEMGVDTPMPMNLAAVVADEPVQSFAGMFTRNRFPGAPVVLARERMCGARMQAVLMNNKVANVGAPNGIADAEEVIHAFGRATGIDPQFIIPASTGVIGWSLPVEAIVGTVFRLAADLSDASILPVAQAIMTTDAFPKLRSVEIGDGCIVGIAKGAGMIEPNLATMLVFFFTDIEIERAAMRRLLAETCEISFNRISVDGDQSTSDMVLMMSTGKVAGAGEEEMREAMRDLGRALAEDIVRNGEGTAHVIRVSVEQARNEREAEILGKAVINSPLVKAAIFGNDPNVGRIAAALGDCAGNHDIELRPERLSVSIAGEQVLTGGRFELDGAKEQRLSSYLKHAAQDPTGCGYPQHDRTVEIAIACAVGAARAEVVGADLSYEYVRENADYRS